MMLLAAAGACERRDPSEPDPDRLHVFDAEARRLLAEYAGLDASDWPASTAAEKRMAAIDRDLVDLGRRILECRNAAPEIIEVSPLGLCVADLDAAPTSAALWRRWVGLDTAIREAERQYDHVREERAGACTPPAEWRTLLEAWDERDRVREALRRAYTR